MKLIRVGFSQTPQFGSWNYCYSPDNVMLVTYHCEWCGHRHVFTKADVRPNGFAPRVECDCGFEDSELQLDRWPPLNGHKKIQPTTTGVKDGKIYA